MISDLITFSCTCLPFVHLLWKNVNSDSLITSWEIDGETVETVSDFNFYAPKSVQMVLAAMKLKDTYSLEGKL